MNKLMAEVRGNPYTLRVEWDDSGSDGYVVDLSMVDSFDGSRMKTRLSLGELKDLSGILKGFTG